MDAIPLAFNHARAELLHPFRFGFWMRMGVVAFFAGELGGGGGISFPTNFYHPPSHRVGGNHFFAAHAASSLLRPDWLRPEVLPFLVLLIAAGVALMFIFLYIHSVFRFILFESALRGDCGIRAGWSRWRQPGQRYLLFLIAFIFISWSMMLLLIGLPVFLAWRAGIFHEPGQHLPLLIGGGLALFFVFICLAIVLAVIGIAVKDFFVPIMALGNRDLSQAWEEFQRLLLPEKSALAFYFLMKICLTIGVGILLGIVNIFLILVLLLLPGISAALVVVFLATVSKVAAIIVGVVLGSVAVALLLYLMALIAVPAAIFFQMYTLYFLGWRYPQLASLLWPEPPPAAAPA